MVRCGWSDSFLWAIPLISTLVQITNTAPPGLTSCGGKPADIIFVLDASGSIWKPHFVDQLKFVRDTVEMFDLGPGKTRIGLYTFGTRVREEISLDEPIDRATLLKKIPAIDQLRGNTHTDKALNRAYMTLEEHGRKGLLQVVIIMTDGASDYGQLTKDMAHMLHDAGIITMSIGIGSKINQQELVDLASKPEYKFTVETFSALKAIRQTLAISACEAEVPIVDKCGGKPADIVFVLDASGSIWKGDFQKQLDFVRDVADIFDISSEATRVGVMTFGNEPEDQFTLDAFRDKTEVEEAVGRIRQQKGETYTNIALRHMLYYHFDKVRSRPGIVKIGIVITDGRSNEPQDTEQEAAEAKKLGVRLFAIGVGKKVDEKELKAIASQPTESFMFQVENFSALDSIKRMLAVKACAVKEEEVPIEEAPEKDEPDTPVQPPCVKDAPADVVIALPARVTGTEMSYIISWIQDLVEKSDDKVRFGIAAKDCPPMPSFHLKDFVSKKDMLVKLNKFRFSPADTAAILKRMRNVSFKDCPKEGTKKIGVVVLDQPSSNLPITTMEAFLAVAKQGLELFVVSIGKQVSEEEKMAIAAEPETEHILDVPDYDSLSTITQTLLDKINEACVGH